MPTQKPFDSTPTEVDTRSIRGRSRILVAGFLLSAAFCGCYAALPASTYRTHAVLAIGDGTVALRAAMARVAAESAVSKPVIERAAGTLVIADRKAPAPGLAERIGVVTGTGNATSQQARLGESIAPMLRAEPGLVPGTVEITASAPSAERAAQLADALADAFVTQQDDAAAQARARHDAKIGARLDAAQAEALAARRRLIGLGGVSLDPAQAHSTAVAQTSAAEARLASVKAIIASSSPPISDRKDLPPVLAVPQAAYLDLKAQLDKESQVLGERHTTIIALQEGVKTAAAKLQAEWKRLQKIAETDVVTAEERETALRKGDTPTDATRRAQVEEARRALQTAEDAVALVQKQTDAMPEDPSFRLIARAPVPNAPVGMSQATRLLLSMLAGLGTLAFARGCRLLLDRRGKIDVALVEIAPKKVEMVRRTPLVRPGTTEGKQADPLPVGASVRALATPAKAPKAPVEAPVARFFEDEPEPAIWTRRTTAPLAARPKAEPKPMPMSMPRPVHEPVEVPRYEHHHEPSDADMTDAMRAILAEIDGIEPRQGGLPTVMVAANEAAAATMPVTLALARVAAEASLRVLLIETDRARPQLAASADAGAEPVLLDLFGTLRIALRAEDGDGFLTLAPVLRDAARLASDLAMARTTAFIDDLAFAFDLILIDGAVAAEAAAAGWTADAFVRVGLAASRRDDERLCVSLGADPAALLTTILPADIEPEIAPPVRKPVPVSRAPRATPVRPGRVAPPATTVAPRPLVREAVTSIMVPRRLVLLHTMDPRGDKLGGIETHVRLVVARHAGPLLFVGVDEIGDMPLGEVTPIEIDGRSLEFLPVARVPAARINTATATIFGSTTLRFALGALRHIGAIRRAAGRPASCEIERFEFAILPKLLGLPFVLMVHNEGSKADKMDSLLKRYWVLHLFNERVALRLADRIFAVNEAIAARIATLGGALAAKTEVMSVSVDTARFTPSPIVVGDTFHVCFAGRLDDFKDPPLMVATLAALARSLAETPAGRFSKLAFDYVGASDPTRIPGFAAIEPITMRHGICRAPQVAAIMAGSHAGIITSFFEGMPCYLLEMLASGRPVGAIRLPQFEPLVREGVSGALVDRAETPTQSAAQLAAAFRGLAEAITADRLDVQAIAALAQPYSVESQMSRLFAAHDGLRSG